jgi:hypothetical protein
MDNRALLAGAGLGAAFAFVLDPAAGRRRRALVRDTIVRGAHVSRRAAEATACDMANRARGMVAATRGRLRREAVDDATLVERVRARLGRVCSHPHAIGVDARDGELTLRGPVLAREVDDLVSIASRVRGVRAVVNALDAHESAEGIPALQGEGRLARSRSGLLQSRWAPAARALAGISAAAAGAAVVYARR